MDDLVNEAIEKIQDLGYELTKIKDQAMDQDLDELASELNAIQNSLEVDIRRLGILRLKNKMS